MFDENGKYKQDFSYNEYGAIQSCENPTYDFGFVGYLFDNGMGLYYAQERNYDVLTGRFNREDPLLKKARNVQNQNLYTYCFNKPMTLVDLDGCTPSVGSWLETASDWPEMHGMVCVIFMIILFRRLIMVVNIYRILGTIFVILHIIHITP